MVRDTKHSREDVIQLLAENAQGLKRAAKYGQRKTLEMLQAEKVLLDRELKKFDGLVQIAEYVASKTQTPIKGAAKSAAKETQMKQTKTVQAHKTTSAKSSAASKNTMTIAEAGKFLKINTGRVGWMTRKAGGQRLTVAGKQGKLVLITTASVKAYAKERDAWFANRTRASKKH